MTPTLSKFRKRFKEHNSNYKSKSKESCKLRNQVQFQTIILNDKKLFLDDERLKLQQSNRFKSVICLQRILTQNQWDLTQSSPFEELIKSHLINSQQKTSLCEWAKSLDIPLCTPQAVQTETSMSSNTQNTRQFQKKWSKWMKLTWLRKTQLIWESKS